MTLTKTKKQLIPDFLIYEMDEGKPIYYKGYKEVLNKTKTAEQIMGSSALQSLLVTLILDVLRDKLSDNYLRLSAELGFKFKKKSWRSLDIAIYNLDNIEDKSIFFIDKYIEIPPEITIEVDTKADLTDLPDPASYFQKKTDQLLEHGINKVIWIFTATRKFLIAQKDQPWLMDNWSKNIKVMDNVELNIQKMLADF